MREILPGRLWLGNAADARNIEMLMGASILAIVDLALEEPPLQLPRSMVYCRFPVVDGEDGSRQVLQAAVETLVSLVKQGIPTLVYCRAGMSRSRCLGHFVDRSASRLRGVQDYVKRR